MRQKLIALAFALAAIAASIAPAPAAAGPNCPENTFPIACSQGQRIICCPINAICVC